MTRYQPSIRYKIDFRSGDFYVHSSTESLSGVVKASFARIQSGKSDILKSPFSPDANYFFFSKKFENFYFGLHFLTSRSQAI